MHLATCQVERERRQPRQAAESSRQRLRASIGQLSAVQVELKYLVTYPVPATI